MNQIAWQIYGGSKAKANTFIGGVASTITTAGALATKLGIASNRITNFKIVGSDIECRISGEYTMTVNCWNGDSSLTYYKDNDGLVVNPSYRFMRANANLVSINFPKLNSLSDECFINSYPIEEINLPLLTTMSGNYGAIALNSNLKRIILPQLITATHSAQDTVFRYLTSLTTLYIPRCTNLGATQGRNGEILINSNLANLKIYAHPSMQTSNGGGVEGDLAYAISKGATVIYVSNFTAPNPITNLSAGTTYGTAVQLNFTAPTGSANAIDYYELWQNGVNTGKTVTASGQYITGLTLNTAYTFQLIPVDIFYNKSTSNSLTVSTSIDNLEILLSGLSLYYNINKTESYPGTGLSLNDISGNSNNGLLVNGTGYSSSDGGSLVFDGINDYVSIANPTGIASQNFTISLWIKPLAPPNAITALFDYDHGTAGSTQGYVIQSEDATTNRRYYLAFYTASGFQPSGFIGSGKGVQITNGVWQMLSYVKNGNIITGYINDVELYKVTATNGTVIFIPNKNASLGTAVSSTGRITKGNIAKNMIYNRALTENEIAFNFSQTRSLYGI